MLGSFGVGKSSLVRRFVYSEFQEDYLSTIGVHIHKKTIALSNEAVSSINLILWDIAHIEQLNKMIKNYFRGSQGAIVAFDVTRSQSFQGIEIYLKPYLEINPKSRLIFVGNKIDLVDNEDYSMEQLLRISKTYHAPLVMTSAKTNKNVDELFLKLANLVAEAE
jgi:small GTP-binding protein